jgi:adenylosuccinate lyase
MASGLAVYPQVIARHLREELPFMATENILMAAVAAGGDRQSLHERIRQHSQAAAAVVKEQGGSNDLIERLTQDKAFTGVDIEAAIDPRTLTGRSVEQVEAFLAEVVAPIAQRYQGAKSTAELITVRMSAATGAASSGSKSSRISSE